MNSPSIIQFFFPQLMKHLIWSDYFFLFWPSPYFLSVYHNYQSQNGHNSPKTVPSDTITVIGKTNNDNKAARQQLIRPHYTLRCRRQWLLEWNARASGGETQTLSAESQPLACVSRARISGRAHNEEPVQRERLSLVIRTLWMLQLIKVPGAFEK